MYTCALLALAVEVLKRVTTPVLQACLGVSKELTNQPSARSKNATPPSHIQDTHTHTLHIRISVLRVGVGERTTWWNEDIFVAFVVFPLTLVTGDQHWYNQGGV